MDNEQQSLFSRWGLKSLLNKMLNAVRPSTRKKHLEELERRVAVKLEKQHALLY